MRMLLSLLVLVLISNLSAKENALWQRKIAKNSNYTSRARLIAVDKGQFFVCSYFQTAKEKNKRPITFLFNGGPGAASIWLHLGCVGPRKVKLKRDGRATAPPFDLVDNPHTWLPFTDLVFIDPMGTGFSHCKDKDKETDFWGVKKDIESVAKVIEKILSLEKRWLSPKYLVGESYGTLRAAGLIEQLHEIHGIHLNGVMFISPAIDYTTNKNAPGNLLPYVLLLPTYTATAYLHKLLPKRFQKLSEAMDEAEEFAYKEYLPAIYRGGSQTDKEFTKVAQKFCDLTGLSFSYAKSRRLLVDKTQYAAELLRKKKKVIGCFDSRLYAFTENPTAERVSFDPGDFQGTGPYVAAANHYLRSELKIDMTIPYHFYRNEIWEKWEWTGAPKKGHGFLNMVPMLGREFRKNKNLYLFFATGLYDLVTPYMTAGYTVSQMQLPKSQMYRITNRPYPGGHMFYGNEKALAAFTKDVKNWYQKSSKK